MNANRIRAVALRQFYLLRGNLPRFLTLFVWIAVDIVVWGFMTRYLNGVSGTGVNFIPAVLGAVLLWDFLIRLMHGVSQAFMEDSWSRNLLNVFAAPISVTEYLCGLVLSSVATSLLGLAVMLALAGGVFGLPLLAYGLQALPFLFVLFLTGIALGIFATGIMLRFGPAAEWLVWPMPAVLSPFIGVFYPLSVLPGWMQGVAKALPPSYVFENLRALAAGGHAALPPLFAGLALALFYTLLACLFFARIHRSVTRSGLLARYSSETG